MPRPRTSFTSWAITSVAPTKWKKNSWRSCCLSEPSAPARLPSLRASNSLSRLSAKDSRSLTPSGFSGVLMIYLPQCRLTIRASRLGSWHFTPLPKTSISAQIHIFAPRTPSRLHAGLGRFECGSISITNSLNIPASLSFQIPDQVTIKACLTFSAFSE
jgi:hypothetical protein